MTTGVIKLDSIDEAFDKTVIVPRRTSSHRSNSDRSSSGVSSASNSSSGTPTVTSFSNPAADVLEHPQAYSNPALQLDPGELGSHNAPARNVCTGVVSLRDELWLDIEAHLQPKPKATALSATRTLAEKCRHFVQIAIAGLVDVPLANLFPPWDVDQQFEHSAEIAAIDYAPSA
ncbi:hypothetical protein Y032_0033g2758 [Ancylostoma ceylanicum]|uniref:Uncharacterized protein n=1 Tax=Ancylostoma ceylanicum TaxID=53326 RepID=A0A016UNY4_9BILA|nr:hypothetical protein Y032_0033g2758 [Ancylostoma ceylanicum]